MCPPGIGDLQEFISPIRLELKLTYHEVRYGEHGDVASVRLYGSPAVDVPSTVTWNKYDSICESDW